MAGSKGVKYLLRSCVDAYGIIFSWANLYYKLTKQHQKKLEIGRQHHQTELKCLTVVNTSVQVGELGNQTKSGLQNIKSKCEAAKSAQLATAEV